jgi:hypothetical protein
MRIFVFAVICLYALTRSAFGQYDVESHVIGNGGGTSANTTFVLTGTIGQSVAGADAGGSASVVAGFWSVDSQQTDQMPPIITTEPASTTVRTGSSVLFSTSATGTPPLYFQWLKNGARISGATATNYAILKTQIGSTGNYQVVVTNAYGATTSTVAALIVIETSKPNVKIVFPSSKGRVYSTNAIARFTASDNSAVTTVQYAINNTNKWLSATNTGYSNWTGPLDASMMLSTTTVSTNVLYAVSMDASTNFSVIKSNTFVYAPMDRLSVSVNGSGSISPWTNGAWLVLGSRYTNIAKGLNGCVFSNWVSGQTVLAKSNALPFVMTSGLSMTANFIPNPFSFLASNNTYQGLFYNPDDIDITNAGALQLTITKAGTYSGTLYYFGGKYPLKGQFGVDGTAVNRLTTTRGNPLSLTLTLNLASQQDLGGSFGNAAWSVPLTAYRGGYYSRASNTYFTVVIPGSDTPANQPGGDGYGTLTLRTNGSSAFAGTLADGTAFSSAANVARNGFLPVYSALNSTNALILGWLELTNTTDSGIKGQLAWVKHPNKGTYYSNGFAVFPEAFGALYAYTTGRAIELTNGIITLSLGNLSAQIANTFTLSSNNVVTSTNSALKLTLKPKTGIFSGSLTTTNLSTKKTTLKFNGILLQSEPNGYGYFLGTNQSGRVFITPAP